MTGAAPPNGGIVTPRELYSQLDAMRSGLGAQIDKVQSTVEKRIAELQADMGTSQKLHDQEHQADRDRRNSLLRWAVTTVMSGGGVLVAIWMAMKGGG